VHEGLQVTSSTMGDAYIGTLKDRKPADPSLRFLHLVIAKWPYPFGGGASDSDAAINLQTHALHPRLMISVGSSGL